MNSFSSLHSSVSICVNTDLDKTAVRAEHLVLYSPDAEVVQALGQPNLDKNTNSPCYYLIYISAAHG